MFPLNIKGFHFTDSEIILIFVVLTGRRKFPGVKVVIALFQLYEFW